MGFLNNIFGKKEEKSFKTDEMDNHAIKFKQLLETMAKEGYGRDKINLYNLLKEFSAWFGDYSEFTVSDIKMRLDLEFYKNNEIEYRIEDANYWYAKVICSAILGSVDNKIMEENIKYANGLKSKDKNLAEWYKEKAKNAKIWSVKNMTQNVEEICRYYKNGKCTAGGQNNSCSANPKDCENCFVWKYNTTGDVSVLY